MEEENRRREEDTETIIVERQEKLLLSHSEHNPTLRIAKFLNPSVTSVTQASPVPSVPLLSETIAQNLTEWPSKVHFQGWKCPRKVKWEEWVNQLVPSHCSIWNQSGICDSILSSIYKFEVDKNLILGLVEFWCPETNSFVFPWGESTITLEDILIIGGFSVLGLPVSSPLDGDHLTKIYDEILQEHRACNKSKAHKVSYTEWATRFMGSESELEHVAFISLWLSKFVFPKHPGTSVRKHVFTVAIHLSQGTRIALAPAILSGLYRELTLLKERVCDSRKNAGDISIWGSFLLVQMWVWEHFPPLRPNSINSLKPGEPRVARWQERKSKCVLSIVRSTLCSSENFQWRPYVVSVNNWHCPLFYKEREELLDVQADDDELMSFFCCLRACEIIGLDGLIQQYLPHRVARQFGFDQDLPGKFCRRIAASLDSDWKLYEKSTRNAKSFVRSRLLESSVTSRYSKWWKISMSVREAKVKKILEQEEIWKNLKSSNQHSSKNVKLSGCSTKTFEENGTHEHSKAEPEQPVSAHESPGAESEEVAGEDDDDKLPIATIFKLDKHQTGTHKPSSPPSGPSAQAKSTLLSSTLIEVGGKKRKLSERTDKELVEKIVDKEGKLRSSAKNPFNAEEYEEGTIENSTHEHSKAEPEQPVTAHESPGDESEEVAGEDDDDKLPIATIFKLDKHQTGTHKPSSPPSGPSAQAQSTSLSSTLIEVGGKKRKLTDKELVEKIVDKEGKLGSSAKNPFNAEEYEEGTVENGTQEHSKAEPEPEPEQPVSAHESPGAESEEVAGEDDDDKLPIATIFKLDKHQTGTHKPSSRPSGPIAQARSTLLSSTLVEVGGKNRKLINKELVENIVHKEGKLGSSAKNPFNAEEYEEGTIEKPVYIDDYRGSRRRSWRETAEAVVILD